MARNLDDSARSERDSIVYDDVASQGNLSIDSITALEDVQEKVDTGTLVKGNKHVKTPGQKEVTKESNKKGMNGQNGGVNELKNVDGEKGAESKDGSSELISKDNVDKNDNDNESQRDKRKIRKDSDKELWTPVKSDSKESMESKSSDNTEMGDITRERESPDNHPTKPPRRNPPRRRLPQPPASTTSKSGPSEKSKLEGHSSTSDDGLSVMSDSSEQKPTEIVCKPVLTSSPNQDDIPNLSVETVDKMDTSRRVLSFLDESTKGGTRKVESFYDFLYSQDDTNSVVEVTSPILVEGDRIGSALSDSDDHLYDSVPVEDSVAESFSRKSGFQSYDEVIVNQGMGSNKINMK